MNKDEMLRDALESMVWQFGYHGTNGTAPIIHTGGLSALEEAFSALDWDDPHLLEDVNGASCDVDHCFKSVSGSGCSWKETGYWCCCSEHNSDGRDGKPQPTMKARAIERENRRDRKTGIVNIQKEREK